MRAKHAVAGTMATAAAVLPLAASSPTAVAAVSDINVTAYRGTVSVVTHSCTAQNSAWGKAALLSAGQTLSAQGRQATLTGTSVSQSAAWYNVAPGTYTVVVVCSNGTTAGTQSVVVATTGLTTASPSAQPTRGVTAVSPSVQQTRGSAAGVGGGTTDFTLLARAVGGTLLALGCTTIGWYLRRWIIGNRS